MAYGKGLATSDGMNQHKALAGAGSKGSFNVTPYPARNVPHPDVGISTQPLADGSRGAGAPMNHKGVMRQPAPDHGGMGPDHFGRG